MRTWATAEEILKGTKHKLRYYRFYTDVTFENISDRIDFEQWLREHDYECVSGGLVVEYWKTPIHAHRLPDARRYPNLKLYSST